MVKGLGFKGFWLTLSIKIYPSQFFPLSGFYFKLKLCSSCAEPSQKIKKNKIEQKIRTVWLTVQFSQVTTKNGETLAIESQRQ
ncbi:MAG TPA: hypothetical protein DCY88_03665 [Cyanobacteria bacterium UBA11372]|nr:hypothetical protein [Cyanobacteria bacterium UBA11372]